MGKNQKTNPIKYKIGIAFDAVLLEQLDTYAKHHFKNNRSDANRYILKKFFKERHTPRTAVQENYRPL